MLELTTILEISIFWACFGFVWVLQLTEPNGLLSAIPTTYDHLGETLKRILICVPCFAGWGAIFTVLGIHSIDAILNGVTFTILGGLWVVGVVLFDILRASIFAMTLAKLMQSFSERR